MLWHRVHRRFAFIPTVHLALRDFAQNVLRVLRKPLVNTKTVHLAVYVRPNRILGRFPLLKLAKHHDIRGHFRTGIALKRRIRQAHRADKIQLLAQLFVVFVQRIEEAVCHHHHEQTVFMQKLA